MFDDADGKTVAPNNRGDVLRSVEDEGGDGDVVMDRPVPVGGDPYKTWNDVFNECEELLKWDSVTDISVGDDDWQIDEAGGVVLRLMVIRLPAIGGGLAEVTVNLWGNGVSRDPFLPEADGDTSTFWLTKATIHGQSLPGAPGPRRSCVQGGGTDEINLDTPSILEITASSPQP